MISLALSLTLISSVAAQRSITVSNACPFTIWPAFFTSSGGRPSQTTGWVAPPLTNVSFTIPNDWNGRIWGRRNCDFTTNPGANSCLDGGCNGGLVCDVNTGTGIAPATLAEFFLPGDGLTDFYDVSLVDGFNLPMRIDNNAGCAVTSCPVDLGPNCPSDQKGPFDASGAPVGCKSACTVDILAGNADNSPNCCTGTHGTPATCPPTGVRNYAYFKSSCPNAYAYVYDDAGESPLESCASSKKAAYTITFCP
ncbi:thaumatin, partial [Mycena latifolia]